MHEHCSYCRCPDNAIPSTEALSSTAPGSWVTAGRLQVGGSPAVAGGSPAEVGGSHAEVGGSPAVVGGSPAEVGGSLAEVGGSPAEVGGSPAVPMDHGISCH